MSSKELYLVTSYIYGKKKESGNAEDIQELADVL